MVKICAKFPPDLKEVHACVAQSFGKDASLQEVYEQEECDIVLMYSLAGDYTPSAEKEASKPVIHVLVKQNDTMLEGGRDETGENVLLVDWQDQRLSEEDCAKILEKLSQQQLCTDLVHGNPTDTHTEEEKQSQKSPPRDHTNTQDTEQKEEMKNTDTDKGQEKNKAHIGSDHTTQELTSGSDQDIQMENADTAVEKQQQQEQDTAGMSRKRKQDVQEPGMAPSSSTDCTGQDGPISKEARHEDQTKDTNKTEATPEFTSGSNEDIEMKTADAGAAEKQEQDPKQHSSTENADNGQQHNTEEVVEHDTGPSAVLPGEKYVITTGKKTVQLYTLVPNNVKKHCQNLLTSLHAKKVTEATEMSSVEECDVILAVCPVVSRLGTDVEAALKDIPSTRPCILVVMHITFDKDYVAPDSSRFTKGKNVVTVDCLFSEDDGLLKCPRNDKAVETIHKKLTEHAKDTEQMSRKRKPEAQEPGMAPSSSTDCTGQDGPIPKEARHEDQTKDTNKTEEFTSEDMDLKSADAGAAEKQEQDPKQHSSTENADNGKQHNTEVVVEHDTGPSAVLPGEKYVITTEIAEHDKEVPGPPAVVPGDNYVITIGKKTVKLYTLVPNNVKKHCQTLLTSLHAVKVTEATEVSSVEECDVILAVCPVVSRLGTDVEAALKDIPSTKPCILVVMHITFDGDFVVPDSSRFAKGKNVVTVDCLFSEDDGLLTCSRNNKAVETINKHLKEHAKYHGEDKSNAEATPSGQDSKISNDDNHASRERDKISGKKENILLSKFRNFARRVIHEEIRKTVKLYTVVPKNVKKHCQTLLTSLDAEKVAKVTQASSVEECDVILAFCPVVSRLGTDVEAALKGIPCKGIKPCILVVMHITFDKDYVAPDSSRFAKEKNVVTVDCLFSEDDGLLKCSKNNKAVETINKHLKEHAKDLTKDTNKTEDKPDSGSNQDNEMENGDGDLHQKKVDHLKDEAHSSDENAGKSQKHDTPETTTSSPTDCTGQDGPISNDDHHAGEERVEDLAEDTDKTEGSTNSSNQDILEPHSSNQNSDKGQQHNTPETVEHYNKDTCPSAVVPGEKDVIKTATPSGQEGQISNDDHLASREGDKISAKKENILLSKFRNFARRVIHEEIRKTVKLYTVVPKNVKKHCQTLLTSLDAEKVAKVTQASSVEECDVILAFCPVVSRLGTDVEAALKGIPCKGTKPCILVVMHITFDKDYVAPDSSRFAREKGVVTVDCLFSEDDGLLQCSKNNKAVETINKHLKEHAKDPTEDTYKMEDKPDSGSNQDNEMENGDGVAQQEKVDHLKDPEPHSSDENTDKGQQHDTPETMEHAKEDTGPSAVVPGEKDVTKAATSSPTDCTGQEGPISNDDHHAGKERIEDLTEDTDETEATLGSVTSGINQDILEPHSSNQNAGKGQQHDTPETVEHDKEVPGPPAVVSGDNYVIAIATSSPTDFTESSTNEDHHAGREQVEDPTEDTNKMEDKPDRRITSNQDNEMENGDGVVHHLKDEPHSSNGNTDKGQQHDTPKTEIVEHDKEVPGPPAVVPGDNYVITIGKKTVKLYTLVPNNVKKHCQTLLTSLHAVKVTEATEVSSVEECDVILAFCPVVSRLGTDVEAALKDIPNVKPCILVVMHITFDRDYVAPDSSRFAKEKDVVTVDCLFSEDDGLLKCSRNNKAVETINKTLQEHAKGTPKGRKQKKKATTPEPNCSATTPEPNCSATTPGSTNDSNQDILPHPSNENADKGQQHNTPETVTIPVQPHSSNENADNGQQHITPGMEIEGQKKEDTEASNADPNCCDCWLCWVSAYLSKHCISFQQHCKSIYLKVQNEYICPVTQFCRL
ncbi:uncharacterized protein LOC134098105 isoform X2 [Sardina pilchardus]|uniref:uncharacterized protein LOC134098105 isoform X2 n=1 Tax=Sardina pilchardus TaxID=27697 RepID=UPI002E15374C